MASERDTEEHKYGKDVAAVSSIPAMQPSESNRIAIIISPRATTASKIVPLELISHGSDPQASHATPPPRRRRHHHQLHPSFPNMAAVPLIKKVMAEFLRTFILTFTVLCTIIMSGQHDGVEGLLGIAASAGLAATVLVLSIIHISGCHLNPAVSIVMAVFGYLPLGHVFPYITAQVLGSIAASFGPKAIYHPVNAGIVTVPRVGTVQTFFVEFITTFVLFAITGGLITPVTA